MDLTVSSCLIYFSFLAEKLRCQQALLASACDRQAALALYDVVSLVEASTHCQLTSGSTHNQGDVTPRDVTPRDVMSGNVARWRRFKYNSITRRL